MALPICDVCGVEYVETYEGPCTEPVPSATDEQLVAGTARTCPGKVSWRAAAEALGGRIERAKRYRQELFAAGLAERRDGHSVATGRATRAPGA